MYEFTATKFAAGTLLRALDAMENISIDKYELLRPRVLAEMQVIMGEYLSLTEKEPSTPLRDYADQLHGAFLEDTMKTWLANRGADTSALELLNTSELAQYIVDELALDKEGNDDQASSSNN